MLNSWAWTVIKTLASKACKSFKVGQPTVHVIANNLHSMIKKRSIAVVLNDTTCTDKISKTSEPVKVMKARSGSLI